MSECNGIINVSYDTESENVILTMGRHSYGSHVSMAFLRAPEVMSLIALLKHSRDCPDQMLGMRVSYGFFSEEAVADAKNDPR